MQVADFGLSRIVSTAVQQGRYAMTGLTGTLRYMAPEVLRPEMHMPASPPTSLSHSPFSFSSLSLPFSFRFLSLSSPLSPGQRLSFDR